MRHSNQSGNFWQVEIRAKESDIRAMWKNGVVCCHLRAASLELAVIYTVFK